MSLVDERVLGANGQAFGQTFGQSRGLGVQYLPGRPAPTMQSPLAKHPSFTKRPPFAKRCAGLLVRSAVLALGLSLGGVGPVLGAAGTEAAHDRKGPHPGIVPVKKPAFIDKAGIDKTGWRDHGDLVVLAHLDRASSTWAVPPRFLDGPVDAAPGFEGAGDGFKETITNPVLWQQWEMEAMGRDQVFGFGLLHPGARPDIMRKRASTLELRFYMPY
jgi:hypothetical protein